MEIKILQVFYGKDGLPYKDKDRQVHFPITGTGFLGASNTTKIKFYYDELDNLDETTWVAVSKLPNGKVGSRVLESYLDEELNEHYALLELDNYYTQYKGDVFISLQGYQGGVDFDYDEENSQYEIHGTPTIAATGSIKFTINYANQFVGSGETDNINFQRILAALGTKLGMRAYSEYVEELPSEGSPDVFYVIKDEPNNPNLANIYAWNENTRHYIWVGDNTLDLGNYYTQEQGDQFESGIDNRVTNVENELSSVASGSPKGVYATLSDLESAYPTGTTGIYVVQADGHWYYWSSTNEEWADGGIYQSAVGVVPETRKVDGVDLSADIDAKDMLNKVQSLKHSVLDRISAENVWNSYINQYGVINQFGGSQFRMYFVSHKIYVRKGWVIKIHYDSAITNQNSFAAFDSDNNAVLNVPITTVGTSYKYIEINNSSISYIRLTLKGLEVGNCSNVNVIVNGEWTDTPLEYIHDNFVSNNITSKSITNDKLDFLERVVNNLFDKSSQGLKDNYYLDTSGNELAAGNYAISDYIEVKEGCYYYFNNNSTGSYNYGGAYYDENKNFLSNANATFNVNINGATASMFVAIKNAKYIRLNVLKTNVNLNDAMFIENTFSSTYIPFSQIEYKASKKIEFLTDEQLESISNETKELVLSKYNYLYKAKMISYGDSVCYGAGWQGGYTKLIGDKYQMTYDNYGVSGTAITPNMKNGPDSYVGCIRERVNDITPSYTPDFVLLEGGINDYNLSQQNPIWSQYNTDFNFGTYDMKNYDVSSFDDTTFCGSFEKMLSIALSKYQGSKIIFVLIHKWANIYKQGDTQYNTVKDWYNYWVPAIKDMCKKWGISLVDLNDNCPPLNYITAYRTTYTDSGDGIHPNENGYKLFYVPQIEKEMVRWVEYD